MGRVKEAGQSEESGQVQLRKEAVELVEVVGDDRRLRWVEQGEGPGIIMLIAFGMHYRHVHLVYQAS